MATNYDRRDLEDLYDDLSAVERRRRQRYPRTNALEVLAWIAVIALLCGVGVMLAINAGALPESMLGPLARQAPQPQPTIVTRPITEARPGFASDTQTSPAANIAADTAAPVSANPDAAGDVMLGHPEAVGDGAAPAVVEVQATPSEAESGLGGGGGLVCDSGWANCTEVDIVPLAAPRAEVAAPESDAGWGKGGGSGVQPQPTPDAEHSGSYGSGGGGGMACDASWSNCEVTP